MRSGRAALLGVAACALAAACKPAPPPGPTAAETAWAASNPLEGRDAIAAALTAIRTSHGDCEKVDDFAFSGVSGLARNYVVRCDAGPTLFQLTQTGAQVTATPLPVTDDTNTAAQLDNESLDDVYGARLAFQTLTDLKFPCTTPTAFALAKAQGATKLYKAQCDGDVWYVVAQQGGMTKVLRWTGQGEPH
jgi:hypothetical protein